MRNKFLALVSFLLFTSGLYSQTTTIREVLPYLKLGGSKLVVLLSDNTIWEYSEKDDWEKFPATGLPANHSIKLINSYYKTGLNAGSTISMVLDDNSMWWFTPKKNWESISLTGLPPKASIKLFEPYVRPGMLGQTETRLLVILEDNSLWWYQNNKEWKPVSMDGLIPGIDIMKLGVYMARGGIDIETRYLLILKDNSMWQYKDKGKKWEEFELIGLPENPEFKLFEGLSKVGTLQTNNFSMTTYEGLMVGVLADESIWTYYPQKKKKGWTAGEFTGLPTGAKIKSLELYQKFVGYSFSEIAIVVALENNTIWAAGAKKEFKAISLAGLPVKIN